MNHAVTIGGIDCASRVVSIHREQSLCSSVHTATVNLDPTWGQAFSPYDEVVIHEDGTKVFTGYAIPVEKQRLPILGMVEAQDPSKRVQDTWLETEFSSAGSTPTQVLSALFDMAGVSYSLNDTLDEILPDQDWQYVSVWDIIEEVLTMAGWQIYADPDGVLQVGELRMSGTPDHTFQAGVNLIDATRQQNDTFYRNAVGVYGSGISVKLEQVAPILGGMERAGAFANPHIRTEALANDIAQRALQEFNRLLDVKTCEILGDPTVVIGNTARVIESFTNLHHDCMVTTVRSTMDQNGYLMDVVLDERCPVIWGHDSRPRILYSAPNGHGVYRSDDYGELWYAANGTGGSVLEGDALTVYAIEANCLDPEDVWAGTENGLYRSRDGGRLSWAFQDMGGSLTSLTGQEIPTTGGSANVRITAIDQDELHPERVYFLAETTGGSLADYEAWVVCCSGGSWNDWPVRWK